MKTASNTQQLGTKIEENCDFKEILQKIQTHTKVYTTETKANGWKNFQQKTNEISLHFLPEYAPMTPKNPPKKVEKIKSIL